MDAPHGWRAGPGLDELLWEVVQRRWQVSGGAPKHLTLLLDSTVVRRYGLKQAGAEKGYNPQRPRRPSHHPLLAFAMETADCLGVIGRGGSAHTAEGAIALIRVLVERLRSAGVEEITLRLDKGFFSKAMVEALEEHGVSYYLKLPDWTWVRTELGRAHRSRKDPHLWSRSGTLYEARLLSVERRRRRVGALGIESFELEGRAHVLTNVEGIHAISAFRRR